MGCVLNCDAFIVIFQDGEVSIPRRVFYDVCKAYLPYKHHVTATFTRLLVTFLVIILSFSMIIHFQIMNEFSQVIHIYQINL